MKLNKYLSASKKSWAEAQNRVQVAGIVSPSRQVVCTAMRHRHLLVDTLGLVLVVIVTAANVPERKGLARLLSRSHLPRLHHLWLDKGYRGQDFAKRMLLCFAVVLEIVSAPKGSKGFVLQHRRWVVERTFAWLGNYRRLAKDYEHLSRSSEAFIYMASL